MPKFMRFDSTIYSAGGGIADLTGCFDTLADAKAFEPENRSDDSGHILDVDSMIVVAFYYSETDADQIEWLDVSIPAIEFTGNVDTSQLSRKV